MRSERVKDGHHLRLTPGLDRKSIFLVGNGLPATSAGMTDESHCPMPAERPRAMPSARMRLSRSGYFSPSCSADWANSSILAISGLGLASMK